MVIVTAVLHPKRIEYALLQSLLVRHSGNLLDDRPQQKVSRVVVLKFGAWLESQIAAAILLYKLLDSIRIAAHILEETWKACIAWNARCMSQQVVDSYLLAG